jgi:hypothetical protein
MITKYTDFVNEVLASELETSYIFDSYITDDGNIWFTYEFKTNRGNVYKIDLCNVKSNIYDQGYEYYHNLSKFVNLNSSNIVVVSFSLKSRGFNINTYDKPTDFNEQYEVLQRITYIMKCFIKKYSNYNCIVVTCDIDPAINNSKIIKERRIKNKLYMDYCEYVKDMFYLVKVQTSMISKNESLTYILIKK